MLKILIDQEGVQSTAHELRAIDTELDALRGRMRGAAAGFMPPHVIARIGATTTHAELVLHGSGERMRVEAFQLEMRAAIAEAGEAGSATLDAGLDFLDRAGLLGMAGLAGLTAGTRGLYRFLGGSSGLVGLGTEAAQAELFPRRFGPAPVRGLWHLAGNRGGNQLVAFGRYANRYSSLAGKPVQSIAGLKVSPGTVKSLGAGAKWLGHGARVIGAAVTFHDVYSEQRAEGRSETEAASAGVVVTGSSVLVGGAFAVAGAMVAGPGGGIVAGTVGSFVGEQVGHGLLHVSDQLSDALVEPYIAATEAIDDASEFVGDAVDSAGDFVGKPGRGHRRAG